MWQLEVNEYLTKNQCNNQEQMLRQMNLLNHKKKKVVLNAAWETCELCKSRVFVENRPVTHNSFGSVMYLPIVLCLLRCLPSCRRLKGAELTGSALAANLASRPNPLSSQPSSSESDSSLSSSSSSEVSVSEKTYSGQRGMWLQCGSESKVESLPIVSSDCGHTATRLFQEKRRSTRAE